MLAGVAATAVGVGIVVRGRFRKSEADGSTPDALPPDDAMFTVFAPGGKYGFWCNGPFGRVTAKLMPIVEAGVYETVAGMLDLQPEDELLDIGSGPGAFLATKAGHVRSVIGLDPSPLMRREAERRLADRIAAGTARIVPGSADALPFGDGEFSAVTAIFAPVHHGEALRVLRPGGRLVFVDQDARRSADEPAGAWGIRRYSEADHRRMFEEAGFTDLAVRYRGRYLFIAGHRPPSHATASPQVTSARSATKASEAPASTM
jgi:SAM-dependent methyltransferase